MTTEKERLEKEMFEVEKKLQQLKRNRKKTHSLLSEEKQAGSLGQNSRKSHHHLTRQSLEQLIHLGRYEKEEWHKAKGQKASVENKISQTRREQRGINFIRTGLVGVLILSLIFGFYLVFQEGTLTGAAVAEPLGADSDLRVKKCDAKENAAGPPVPDPYDEPCDGTYPSACGAATDLLSCDDGNLEVHNANPNTVAGVRVNVSNSSITNCGSITKVDLCYERWVSDNTALVGCLVQVDANGDGAPALVTDACPGATANPGMTCTDVTSAPVEGWSCSSFFGATTLGSLANIEAATIGAGPITLSADALFFNVTYDKQGEACGTLTIDATMTKNLNASKTCFTVGASHITLNCAGREINYSTNGAASSGITNSGGYDNVTIKNCVIKEGAGNGSNTVGISFYNGGIIGATIYNNTIITVGSSSDGIQISDGTNNTNITGNNITISGANSYGIKLNDGSSHHQVYSNFIKNSGSGGGGLVLDKTSNNTFLGNNITIIGTGLGLFIGQTNLETFNNTFINTTVWTTSNFTVMDQSDSSKENILSYYSSFGEVNWTSGNLTTNLSLIIGTTIFLENKTLGVVDDAVNMMNLNKTANITMKGLPYTSAPWLLKAGVRCDNTNACNISFDSTNGILTARVASFSNYTTNALPTVDTVVLNTTDISKNDTNQNVTLYFNSTDKDGNPVKNITNWRRNGTSIMVLNMPFERINGTSTNNAWDYSGFGNNGSDTYAGIWNSTGGYDGKGAYHFNGINNNISLGNPSSLQFGNIPITITAWIYPTLAQTGYIYAKRNTTDGGFSFYMYGTQRLIFLKNPDGLPAGSNTNVPLNQWSHVAAAYNGSMVTYYLNGAADGTDTNLGTTINNDISATIGSRTGGVYFKGTIDNVQVYNRSLSAQQILALFNNRTDLIVSQETNRGDNWTADITPNDGREDGVTARSNQVIIKNALPTQGTPVLNTTNPSLNDTAQNLTAYNVSTADIDEGDRLKSIFNWRVNGTSILVLNMPFERINGTSTNNAWDYSGFGNNLSEFFDGGASWNATTGYDGRGAYRFNGGDYLAVNNTNGLNLTSNFTITFWIYRVTDTGAAEPLLSKSNDTDGNINLTIDGNDGVSFSLVNGTGSSLSGTYSGVSLNAWTFITLNFNGSYVGIYVNGSIKGATETGNPSFTARGSFVPLRLARERTDNNFDGYMDEVQIYNRSLSSEQILALFNNRTDLIVSQEITSGQNWTVDITPNDGREDGAFARSNQLIVLGATANTRPTAPLTLNPLNGSSLTDRSPPLNWTNSTDAEGDVFSYHVQVDDNILFLNPEINVSSIAPDAGKLNTTYFPTAVLNVDTKYYWRVRANDSGGYGAWSNNDALNTSNFTVDSYLAISFTTDLVNFGSLSPGQVENTTDNVPSPFNAENAGNIYFNVSINGSAIFESTGLNNSNYQFKMRESKPGSFDLSQSSMSWRNVSKDLHGLFHLAELNWRNANDNFITDLNLTVPDDEPPGAKAANFTFTITGSSVS